MNIIVCKSTYTINIGALLSVPVDNILVVEETMSKIKMSYRLFMVERPQFVIRPHPNYTD